MIMFSKKLKFLLGGLSIFIFSIFYGQSTFAKSQTTRGVGPGLAFAPPSYSTVTNPAVVSSAPQAALAGSYRTENKNPAASFVGSTGLVGIGATYRREGEKYSSDKKDVVEGELGARALFLSVGGVYRKIKDESANYDVAVMADLAILRVGSVFRNIKNGPSRTDYFVGMKLANFLFEADVKKARPFNEDKMYLDVGASFVTSGFSLAVGYDAPFENGQMGTGQVHGGLSFRLIGKIFVEAMYRPFVNEWTTSDWLGGMRVVF